MTETGLILHRTGTDGGLCEGGNEPPGTIKATCMVGEETTEEVKQGQQYERMPFIMYTVLHLLGGFSGELFFRTGGGISGRKKNDVLGRDRSRNLSPQKASAIPTALPRSTAVWNKINANKTKTMAIGGKVKRKRAKSPATSLYDEAAEADGNGCDHKTWTLRRNEEKRIEPFEMWIWRRMELVKWTDRIRNEAVLEREGEERMMPKLIRTRKRNWLEEHRLRVFENKVLRKIFGAKRDEVTGDWRKLHNTELHALYYSPDIIRNIKSWRLRWAGRVARMGESRNAYRVLVGRSEGKRPLGRPRSKWEDNIKMDLREVGYDDRDWINLAQDRDRWRAYVRAAMKLRVP
ncbi:hypothetical protein ANN_24130 [Periplaneta americana]|uniref:Uncharacterized protein n=1 Tax=Periplaneta americana TaxID=6978 RepID=A0ABQ8S2I5_PERAM|nr:hypothetical protein ANN_24130 [Periplaneta americana]